MDPDEITKFFQQVMEQLGPTAQRTFQIVGQRVAAESTIWLVIGLIFTIVALILTIAAIKWLPKSTNSDRDVWAVGFAFIIGGFAITGLGLVISSAIVLNSLEYSTIERILTLVGGTH